MSLDQSVFMEKDAMPGSEDLTKKLGANYKLWQVIRDYVMKQYPNAFEEWNYSGAKYGWSFRVKDKKRAILYLLPRDGFFKVAFIFGQKAMDEIMSSDISPGIKKTLKAAKVYAEGRGIRIDINSNDIIPDVKQLVDIKLAY